MKVILVPGYWLTGDSFEPVTSALAAAGHDAEGVTRQGATLAEQIAHLVALVDTVDEPVILVGHSAGGPICHGVVDARPTRVCHVIYVDTWPGSDGCAVNSGLPVVEGRIPLPDWQYFDSADLTDLTDELRAHFANIAVPEPAAVDTDPLVLTNLARREVPIDIIACEFSPEQLRSWAHDGAEVLRELLTLTSVRYHHVPTGHWPQLTKPVELAALIVDIVNEVAASRY
jgi:pimeloyl-ACP methyl ester carboxylesterase